MRKLAEQNLADLAPHPLIEFLLHDHPALARRIQRAEKWKADLSAEAHTPMAGKAKAEG